MQQSWRQDADKLTFIACMPLSEPGQDEVQPGSVDCAERMIGDVNLFIVEDEDQEPVNDVVDLIGEVEIMVARKDLHGKGYGKAILLSFLWYILHNLGAMVQEYASPQGSYKQHRLSVFRVKINSSNARSIALFKSVGFSLVSVTPNYFGEVELRLDIGDNAIARVTNIQHFEEPKCSMRHI